MGNENLARLAEAALYRQGDYDSLFFEGTWHSSGALAERGARFATGLAGLGLRPGDRLLVLMANCPEVNVTYVAAWRAGAVVTPLIFLVSEEELRAALADSAAAAVVTTAEFLPKVTAAAPGAPGLKFIVCVDAPDGAAAAVPVADFAEVALAPAGPVANRAGSDLAALLYTGGTTGRAKGVPLTHASLAWCGRALTEADPAPVASRLLPLPLAHSYGLLLLCDGLHRAELTRSILMRWFDPAAWLRLAAEHRVQESAVVPAMLAMLLPQPLEEHDLSTLTAVASGGSPLPAEVRLEFERRVPGCTVYEGYGCTEAATLISSNVTGRNRPGSVGLPVPGCEVTIRDDAGQRQPAGTDGEICVRSPGVMSGYWGAGDPVPGVLAGGWLHTGDIGHQDADGYLYVVDRKKDLILRGGLNVFPRDIEDVMVAHPAVAQASVVGKPDPRLGEEVVAFVSLRPQASVTAQELVAYARQHLSAAKYPRDVRIMAELPLTDVHKPDRVKLRELAASAAGAVRSAQPLADGDQGRRRVRELGG
jgi:long-chain acyl-CoA synthetase